MKANYKPFGESFKDYFKIGDLVTWRLYSSDAATGELNPRQMTGVITEIYVSQPQEEKSGLQKFLKQHPVNFII